MGVRAGTMAVGLVLLATLLGGCGGKPVVDEAGGPLVAATGTPVEETSAPGLVEPTPTPTHSPTPSRTPTPKPKPKPKAKPKPKPSRNVSIAKNLPPPMPKPAPSGCKPKYVGTQASRAQAKQALTAAADRSYWPTSAPGLKVPLDLIKATAWQESGWQSNIVSCDGGVGLMQVMAGTRDFINQRFDQSYDIDDYQDNAFLGANNLAWLIKYFGDVYFAGDYELSSTGDCASSTDLCLLNAVIAAYNFGFGAVDTDAGLVLPNPQYVRNVRALMTECECLDF